MRRLVTSTMLGLGVLVATATPASAMEWYYTGYWYPSYTECEEGYQDLVGGSPVDTPHECRETAVGVWELWRTR